MKVIGILALVVTVFAFYRAFSNEPCHRQRFYQGYSYPQRQAPIVVPVAQPAYYQEQPHVFGGEFNVQFGNW